MVCPLFSSLPIDFPVNIEEFTLRLRRQTSTITPVPSIQVNQVGPFTIEHDIDGVTSSEVYTFGSAVATDITFKFIEVPILFSI